MTLSKTFALPNGLTIVCEERPNTGKVAMQIMIRCGSLHESPDQAGLTHFMQEACWGGTRTRSRDDLAEEIESRGGAFSSDTARGQTWFAAQALSRDTAAIFEILADAVRNPVFDPEEVEITRDQILTSIEQASQRAPYLAATHFYKAAFAGHAAAHPPIGTMETVAHFTAEQLSTRHSRLLSHPESIVISFVGDLDAELAHYLGGEYFGDLEGDPVIPAEPIEFIGGDFRTANNNEQLSLVFGFEAPSMASPDRYHFIMLQELLSGGMSSPLFQEIREKRGLVYSVGADYMAFESSGLFAIRAGTGRGNAQELMTATFDLLGQIAAKGFAEAEVEMARERIIRGLKGALENDSTACQRLGSQILNFGRVIPLEEYEAILSRVTCNDVQNACATMLKSGRYALGAVGPQDNMPDHSAIAAMIAAQAKNLSPLDCAPVSHGETPFATLGRAQIAMPVAAADPKVAVLPNGMKIVTAERPGSLACGAWVGAGSDHETPELSGATHMNEHMMFKGTPSYGPGQIDKIIEGRLGGDLNAYTTHDKTAYYFYNLLPSDLEQIVDICGEMVFKANLDEEEYDGKTIINPDGTTTKLKGERDVVVEEIKRANDKINSRLWGLLSRTLYRDQPHGRPILGTEDSLRAISASDLAAYRDALYTPNNVVFSAAGPVRHDDFVALIARKFGSMKAVPFAPLPEQETYGGVAYEEMESAQLAQLALVTKGVSERHPDYLAYEALGEILSGGGSSRLYRALVNKTSLTNDVGAGTIAYQHLGQFGFFLATKPERTRDAVALIYKELRALARNLTKEELDKAKAQMEMTALSSIETNNDACDYYGKDLLVTGKVETTAEICARIRKITMEDIQRILATLLSGDPVLAAIIPQGTDRAILPDYDALLTLRDAQAMAA